MFRRLVDKIISNTITFESWILSVCGIIIIRIFIEQYSNNVTGHFVLIDLSTIIQYSVSFIAILLWCMGIIMYFTKKSIRETALLSIFGFMIIWTPPIIDLIISHGNGYKIYYILLSAKDLFYAYLSMFWTTTPNGMTYGIRIEILLVTISCFALVYMYTKNILKSFLASISMYSGIFIIDSLPSFMGLFQKETIVNFIQKSLLESHIILNSTFSIDKIGYQRMLELGFNSLMIQGNIIIAFIAISIILITGYKEKTKILIKNSRPERILHYVILVLIGAIFGGGISFFNSWVNVLSLIMTMFAFVFAWLSAVCVNDIEDEKIDIISNKNRPIPMGLFTKEELRTVGRIFLIISLLCAYSASLYGLFFVILFSFIFYIYSVPPLKLRRHFAGGVFAIGIASITAISSGFFLGNMSRELFSFPPILVFILGIMFGLGAMIKDLKDYDGDKANNIKTLPVIIGLRASKIVIACILSICFIGLSLYFKDKVIILSSIVASILIWRVLTFRIYNEKYFFIIYICFLVVCTVRFLML